MDRRYEHYEQIPYWAVFVVLSRPAPGKKNDAAAGFHAGSGEQEYLRERHFGVTGAEARQNDNHCLMSALIEIAGIVLRNVGNTVECGETLASAVGVHRLASQPVGVAGAKTIRSISFGKFLLILILALLLLLLMIFMALYSRFLKLLVMRETLGAPLFSYSSSMSIIRTEAYCRRSAADALCRFRQHRGRDDSRYSGFHVIPRDFVKTQRGEIKRPLR